MVSVKTGLAAMASETLDRTSEWLANLGEYRQPLTDVANADRLVNRHAKRLRHCELWKSWLHYDKRRWARDETRIVESLARETVISIYGEISKSLPEADRIALAKHAAKSESDRSLRAMVAIARSDPIIRVHPSAFDADPWLLNAQNGTVDLRTGALRPHRPEDLITKICGAPYIPDAVFEIWDAFLVKVQPDPAMRRFLQRAIGASLTGEPTEEHIFLTHGSGANGKTTFLESVRASLGDYAATADFESFLRRKGVTGAPRNDIARLFATRFVTSAEVEDGRRLAEALIKQLTLMRQNFTRLLAGVGRYG